MQKYKLNPKKIRKVNKNVYEICYSTKESYILYDKLYYENCLCLDRKKNKFEDGIKLRNNKSKTF